MTNKSGSVAQQNQQQQHNLTTSAVVASDVFARAPPSLQQQQQPYNHVLPVVPPDGVHMELPQRSLPTSTGITSITGSTNLPVVASFQQVNHQYTLSQPPTTLTTQQQRQQAATPLSQQITTENPTGSTTLSSFTTPLSSFALMTDTKKSLDELADAFLIGSTSQEDETKDTKKKGVVVSLLAADPLPSHVSDYERLHILVKQRAYMDALLYTRMLLEGSSSHYTSLFDAIKNLYGTKNDNDSNNTSNYRNAIDMALDTHKLDLVNIMTIHITAMIKLNLLQELITELDTWKFCFHHRRQSLANDFTSTAEAADVSDATSTKGELSWIPWTFHILAASTLQYRMTTTTTTTTAHLDCVDALHKIRNAISDSTDSNKMVVSSSSSLALVVQVENALSNVYISMKDYRMALQCMQRVMQFIPSIVQDEVQQLLHVQASSSTPDVVLNDDGCVIEKVLLVTYQSEYLSRQGRIMLQLGALDGADILFSQIKTLYKDVSFHNSMTHTTTVQADGDITSIQNILVRFIKAQVSSNDGLLKFSRGKYEEALESFNTVIQELRLIMSSVDEQHLRSTAGNFVLASIRTNLYNETMNNMALCALYTCRLHEGIQVLESLIRENVTSNLSDRITLNICTMYELAMDTNAALRKKKILQCIATRFLIQDIPVECFRIS